MVLKQVCYLPNALVTYALVDGYPQTIRVKKDRRSLPESPWIEVTNLWSGNRWRLRASVSFNAVCELLREAWIVFILS